MYESDDEPALDASIERLARDPRVKSVQRNQPFEALDAPRPAYRTLEYGAVAIRADLAHRTSTGKEIGRAHV